MLETIGYRNPMRSVYRARRDAFAYHWYEGGIPDGPIVVLVHGYMAHALTFRRIVDALADSFRVIAVDLPAHGRDTTFRDPQMGATMNEMVAWADGLFDLIGPNHVISHSLGATITYDAAKNHALDSVTLVDPGLWLSARRWDEWALGAVPPLVARIFANDTTMRIFERIQWNGPKMSVDERNAYVAPLKEKDRLAYMLRIGRDMLKNADPTRTLTPIGSPTLLLWGEADQLLPSEQAPRMAKQLDADHAIFKNCGHSPIEDVPVEFLAEFDRFLDRG